MKRRARAAASRLTLPADQVESLSQQSARGISHGDVVALRDNRIARVVGADARARTLRLELLPGDRAGVDKAIRSYRAFSGKDLDECGLVDVEEPRPLKIAWLLGELEQVVYGAMRDGRYDSYHHVFKKSARPTLAVNFDGQQLVLLGGGYQVTDRGITDH